MGRCPHGIEDRVGTHRQGGPGRVRRARAVGRSVPTSKDVAGIDEAACVGEHRRAGTGVVGTRGIARRRSSGVAVAVVGEGVLGRGAPPRVEDRVGSDRQRGPGAVRRARTVGRSVPALKDVAGIDEAARVGEHRRAGARVVGTRRIARRRPARVAVAVVA